MDYKNTLKFDRNSVNKYLNLIVDLGKAGNTNEESYYRGFKEFLESFFMPKLGFSIKVGGMDKINENKPDFTVLFDDIPIAIIKAEPPTTIDIEELLEAGYTNNTKNNYDTNNDTNSKLIEDFIRYRNEYGEDISYFITNFTHIYLLEFEEVSIDQNNFENVATVGVDKKGVAKVLVKIRRGVELFRRDYGLDKWAGEGDRQRRSYDVPIVQLEQLFKSATNHLILNIDNIRGLIRQLAKLGRALKSNLYSLYSNKDKLKKLEHAVDKGEMLQQLEIRDMAGNIVGIKGGELDLEHQVLMFLFLEDIYNDFKQSIFHDVLGDYDLLFSDLITQTVIYGIFSAWINYCSKGYKPETFSKEKVADNLPYESFIRHLFWDTTGKLTPLIQNEYISKIIEVFREAQFQRVIRKKENLLTMFYSEFLKEYDRQTAKDRGIVYTPSEIVDFIIKGLDYFLETRYSKEGGIINIDPLFITDKDKGSKSKRSDIYEIADKSKYEMTKQPSVNQKVNLNVNFLDPAAGTMTFPCGLLRYAKKKFLRVYKNERAALKAFAEWIDSYFFDNMYALEILISPYVLGHLRVQMAIEELLNVKGQNYNRHNKENIGHEEERNTISKITLAADIFKRLKFYLLNTLMNPENIEHYLHNSNIRRELESGLRVRNTQKIFVIFGNPPYNVSTQNNSEWINNKIKDYKRGLKEKNLKILSDDYVKFIRFAQWKIKQSGVGIVGFITNNNYLDGAVFKEMRRSLIKTFNEIYIVNLHGNMRKNEAGNPFGIKVGVAIVFFLRTRNENEYNNLNSDLAAKSESLSPNSINELEVYNKNCKLFYWDISADNIEDKYWELSKPFDIRNFKRIPITPDFFFVPKNIENELKYRNFVAINELFKMPPKSGIMSGRDSLVSNPDPSKLKENIELFFKKDFAKLRALGVNVKNTKSWNINKALMKSNEKQALNSIIKYNYRGFDEQYIVYDNALTEGCRKGYLDLISIDNPAICVTRSIRSENFNHALIVGHPPEKCFLAVKDSSYVFLLKSTGQQLHKDLLKYSWQYHNKGINPPKNPSKPEYNINLDALSQLKYKTDPESVFYYVYAILYSNIYRTRYNNQLKSHYPRIPFPNFENKSLSQKLFEDMSQLGRKLAEIHLGISKEIDVSEFKVGGSMDLKIIKPYYDEIKQKIYFNKPSKRSKKTDIDTETTWIAGITPEIWNFKIGDIQQLLAWLKARKFRDAVINKSDSKPMSKRHIGLDRPLNAEELEFFLKLCSKIKLTLELLPKIDALYNLIDIPED